jgi:hypothetical protein
MSSCMNSCDSPALNGTSPCPLRMADGRAFTDYRPRCEANAELFAEVIKSNMVASSYESRMYLQRNTDLLINSERNKAIERLIPCAPCPRSLSDPGTMLGERYVVRCNGASCDRVEVNPNGIGDGRSY